MALSSAAEEEIFSCKILCKARIHCQGKVLIYGDNLGALYLVKNPIYHSRSKNIDIKYHIRNVFAEELIDLENCSSNSNISDILTKNLSRNSHMKLIEAIGFLNL